MFSQNTSLSFKSTAAGIIRPLILLLFCIHSVSFSQGIADTIQRLPHAIKNTEIANYRKNTNALIAASETLILNLKRLSPLKSQVINEDSIFSNKINVLKDSLSRFNLVQLDRLDNRIQEYNVKLNSQEQIISDWRTQSDNKQEQINFQIQNWQLTKDSLTTIKKKTKIYDLTELSILKRVISEVDRSLQRLGSLQKKFTNWNNELIEVENVLTAAKIEANEINSLLNSKRKNVLTNIWVPEYSPIWAMHNDNYTTYYTKFNSLINTRIQRLKEHFNSKTDFYFSFFFSFIFILSIVVFLRIKSQGKTIINPSSSYDILLLAKFPILSTFIILSFVIYIFYAIPFELKSTLLILSIIPFAVLIWHLNPKKKLLTVGFFILYCLIFTSLPFLSEYPVLLRYSLLVINSLSLSILLLLRKNRQLVDAENNYWLGTLPFLISSFIFLNILALIGNIIGNVQLSVILTETIIGTFLTFAIIKESVKLLHSFLYLLITLTLINYSNIIKDDSKKVLLGLFKLLKYSSFFLWFYLILGFLKLRKTMTESFLNFINKPLQVGELSISLGNVIAFYFIIQISVWISQFIRYVLDKEVYPRTSVNPGVASTFSLMIRYTLMVIGFILALAGAGLEYSKIAIGMGALGIGIGFGLQNIVNNFMSGIILAIERPIKIGDTVKLGEIEGQVVDIGLRASQIKTWDGSDVIVPNGSLISEKLVNWTLNDRKRRLDVEVKLDLETDITAATEVILEALNGVPKLLKNPKPFVNFEGLNDGSAIIRVYAWINNYSESFAIGTSFRIALYQGLTSNGFKLANPVLDVNLNEKEPSTK